MDSKPFHAGYIRKNRVRALLQATMLGTAFGAGLLSMLATPAQAQMRRVAPLHVNTGHNSGPNEPVTFQSDSVSYDDHAGIVTWTGNVQVWQGDHVMRADHMTYNRNTGIIVATGNVASTQLDGSVMYATRAELTGSMHDGVMTQVTALMTENARMVGNGMRRTDGKLNDMSRAVYTACVICSKHPDRAPFWQFRAYDAIQDTEHKRIDFQDTYMDILGVPVLYLPFFSISDPSQKRHSGFLMPGLTPHDTFLGTYATIPYYWVINEQSDLLVQGLITTRSGPQLSGIYRNRFNFGKLDILGGLAYDTFKQSGYQNDFGNSVGATNDHGIQGYLFARGMVSITPEWRAGMNINLATSANYMRDYRVQGYGADTLNSNVYLEGFGTGAYGRVDTQFYQGLNQGVISNSALPFVLPHFQYNFLGQPDAWGGRFGLATQDFYVYRAEGVNDQRGQLAMNWDRPFRNKLGQQYLLTLHLDSMLYRASQLYQAPTYYSARRTVVSGQVLPTIALKMNWPFLRSFAKGHGTQIFEPITQVIYAPNTGSGISARLPNEDSLSYEFTDSTLFALNRYQGTDRLDGGLRANVGMHGNWSWSGHEVDLLVGESFQEHIEHDRLPYSGLDHRLSDVVGRARVSPSQYIDFTARGRVNPNNGQIDFGDALFTVGGPHFRLNGGYVWEPVTPFYYYVNNFRTTTPTSLYYVRTSELSGGATVNWANWHASGFARRSLSRKQFVSLGMSAGWQNDCFGLDMLYIKQYTSIGGRQRNSTLLFTVTLKTIGAFGIK